MKYFFIALFFSRISMVDAAVLSSEFIYEHGSYPQVHAASIEETPYGLVAAWFGGTREQADDVGIWVSRLRDGKWTSDVEVANGVQYIDEVVVGRYPTWNPVLFQFTNGPLMLFYKVGPSPQKWWGMYIVSNDGGLTWGEPQELPEGILGPTKNRPIELGDGGVLSPTSHESDETPSKWTIYFEYTFDQGKTWSKLGPVNDGVAIQAIQPSLLRLDERKILSIGRSRQNKIFQVLSGDNGKTWGDVELGGLPNNNSGLDALTLKSGRHIIVYNHVEGIPGQWGGKRTPLNVAVSENGYSWVPKITLEDSPGEYSYPSIVQSKDGLIHVVYTWNRQRIKHVVIDPLLIK